MNIVSSFRLYHESKGVGTVASAAGTTDLFIPSERDPARKFLWSRPRVGMGAGPFGPVQNQMDD